MLVYTVVVTLLFGYRLLPDVVCGGGITVGCTLSLAL